MSGIRTLDSNDGKPIKLGRYELTEEKLKSVDEKWMIVQEVGVGQWFGRAVEWDKEKRVMTLHPALSLSSIPRLPMAFPSAGEPIVGVVTGDDMKGVLGRQAFHPIRDLAYSHYQLASDFDPDFLRFCFLMVGLAAGVRRKDDVERELNARPPSKSVILPQ